MKRIIALILGVLTLAVCFACAADTPSAEPETTGAQTVETETTDAQTAEPETTDAQIAEPESKIDLPDGTYTAEFHTDSSMFHVNEANKGMGILTVKDGKATIPVSLVGKSILNLFPGLAEDAQKEGAVLLEPTVDVVTYEDGETEEVYGFDVPVPAIGEEFDLALIGKKGTWYDHKVSVQNPLPQE